MKKNRTENRKAIPGFVVIVLVSALIGGFIGGFTGFLGGTMVPENIVSSVYHYIKLILPYSIPVVTAAFVISEVILYRKAVNLYENWNGEDEEDVEKAEENISWIILCTSLNLILAFFFFGAEEVVNREENTVIFFSVILAFLAALTFIIIMQQRAVDLTKKINPEKKGSVYEVNFARKWMESCDENEQRQIGICGYKAYISIIYTCIGLWFLTLISSKIFHTGLLPLVVIAIIWGVGQFTYCYQAVQLGKNKNSEKL